ncbi:MAG: hypothetical protein ACKVVP_22540 [Chloroflexota bacterium]
MFGSGAALAVGLFCALLGLTPLGARIASARFQQFSPDACPALDDGTLVQASGPEIYLIQHGVLRWIPNLDTLRALGFDGGAVELLADACLRDYPAGEPFASASSLPTTAPDFTRSTETAPTGTPSVRRPGTGPVGPLAKSGVPTDSTLTISASAAELPVGAVLTLTAQASVSESGAFTLTIQRLRSPGGPAGGLVANCTSASTCVGQTRLSEPATVLYLATLYRCDARGACAAERSSEPVSVRWR